MGHSVMAVAMLHRDCGAGYYFAIGSEMMNFAP